MHTKEEKMQAFGRLLDIMDDLRSQCPWDKKQTMLTLRPLTMEELYELTDAILEGNMPEIKKELGDVLLHLIFYAKIASETQTFDIADVIHSLCEKLIERHPHIYGNISVKNEEEVKKNWEKIKLKTGNKSVLGGVPKSLPALVKAFRIQEKVAGVGFDWENKEDVWTKVEEEISEFQTEVQKKDYSLAEKEFGDVLFSLINYARFLKINPENALEYTNQKFIKRFQYLEELAQEEGKILSEMSLSEMDKLWEKTKNKYK